MRLDYSLVRERGERINDQLKISSDLTLKNQKPFLNASLINNCIKIAKLMEYKLICSQIHTLELLSSCRKQWHPSPVLLPGKSHGWSSLVGCSPWGR